MTADGLNFRYPTKEEVLAHQVIIVTLSTASELLSAGLDRGMAKLGHSYQMRFCKLSFAKHFISFYSRHIYSYSS